ncbi:hypothetical protein [Burkholderia ubonensis]|uniref:hypothetical protein n=1 Tax=Burkholderia ubonensis TaxID=101571 RepID=UPI0018E00391|nr:hypothetical protein [Burkholderia ubonensis]
MPEPGARAIARAVSTILDESARTLLQLIALGPAAAMPLGLRLVPENQRRPHGCSIRHDRQVHAGNWIRGKGYSQQDPRGTWAQGEVWVKAADGRILIDMQGYEQWVETGGTFGALREVLSNSRSIASHAGDSRDQHPPRLT